MSLLFPLTAINQPNVEVAISKVIAGLVVTWLFAWTPYAVVALLGIAGYARLITVRPSNKVLKSSVPPIDHFSFAAFWSDGAGDAGQVCLLHRSIYLWPEAPQDPKRNPCPALSALLPDNGQQRRPGQRDGPRIHPDPPSPPQPGISS